MQNEKKHSLIPEGFVLIEENDYYSAFKDDVSAAGSIAGTAQEDFHLIAAAFENRFWGDDSVIRFENLGGKECRLVDRELFVSYAMNWIFKNKKSSAQKKSKK